MTSIDRKASIARLVSQGHLKHEQPGQYYPDEMSDAEREALPHYDIPTVKKAFPDALQMNFDEELDEDGVSLGMFVVIRDGRTDAPTKIPLGAQPPATTEELITKIQSYFRSQYNLGNMDETAKVLASFGEDDE